jgi:hypothetical protein
VTPLECARFRRDVARGLAALRKPEGADVRLRFTSSGPAVDVKPTFANGGQELLWIALTGSRSPLARIAKRLEVSRPFLTYLLWGQRFPSAALMHRIWVLFKIPMPSWFEPASCSSTDSVTTGYVNPQDDAQRTSTVAK